MPLYVGNERINNVSISFTSSDGGTNTNDATLTSGTQMLQGITAYSKGTKYTGTIPSKASADITVTANTVKVPAGYYSTANTKTVAETTVAIPAISISSDGLITASSAQTAGYVAAKTTTATTQLATQSAKTITPSSSAQVAVGAGKYTTGDITVSAVPTETKTITANGTYSPSNGKYFSSVKVAVAGDIPTYQSKTVTPSTSVQTIIADDGYDALSDVTVSAIKTETKSVTPTTSTQTVTPTSGSYLTKVDVGAISTETKNVIANGTYTPSSGKFFSSVTVAVPSDAVALQEKTITPTESTQVVNPDNGYGGFSSVTVNGIPSTYVGSGVETKGATTIIPSASQQTAVSANTYVTGAITVAAVPSETKNITSNGTYTPSTGKWFSSVSVNILDTVFNTQTKSVTPTESKQTVTPDADYDGLSSVTVDAISSTYIGSNVPTQGAKTVTPSTSVQTAVSSGTYVTGNIKVAAMPTGVLSTPAINTNTGIVTAGISTAGYLGTGATKTLQLNTKSAATIIPSTTDQIIAAGQYLTGIQTIKGDANLVAANIASGVSIFGVTGTHSSIDTSDATATAADIVSGKTAYVKGSKVTGTLIIQNYYTGTTTPNSSLGNNGDLYFKV